MKKILFIIIVCFYSIIAFSQSTINETEKIIHSKSSMLLEMYENFFNLIGDINEDKSAREFEFAQSFTRLFKNENAFVLNDLDPTGKTSNELPVKQYAKNLILWFSSSGIKTDIEIETMKANPPQRVWGNDYFADVIVKKHLTGIYMNSILLDTTLVLAIRISFKKDDNRMSYFKIAGITSYTEIKNQSVITSNINNSEAESRKHKTIDTNQCEKIVETINKSTDHTSQTEIIVQDKLSRNNKFEKDSGFFIDSRDDRKYKWIRIGDQIWMAENLAFLPYCNEPKNRSIDLDRYYVYGNFNSNKEKAIRTKNYKIFGVLYNWSSAKKSCPKGWRLPSNNDWKKLADYINFKNHNFTKSNNKSENLGRYLKSKLYWKNYEYDDLYGFNALPGGFLKSNYGFEGKPKLTFFWSSSEVNKKRALYKSLRYDCEDFKSSKFYSKKAGLYVRCIKNDF